MAFNKYTQITPAKYDARSLQETLYLPTLKRKQHDEMDQQLATTKTALDQYDSLDFQSDLVNEEKQKLKEKIDKQAEQLANQGFKSGSKSQFFDLASEFSEATSINGKIGKAKQIKDNYIANKNRIVKNMVDQGYSPDDAQNFVKSQYDQYKENWDGENLNEIDLLDNPKYMSIEDEFTKLKGLMGSTTIQKVQESGYQITEDDGHFVYTTPSGSITKKTDDKQLNHALAILNNEFLVEGSKGQQSLKVQGIDKTAAAAKISNLMGLSSQSVIKDTRTYKNTFGQIPSGTRKSSGGDKNGSSLRLGTSVTSSSPVDFYESYKDLKAKSVAETEDIKEIRDARGHQKVLQAVERKAKEDPNFKRLNNSIDEKNKELNDIPEQDQEIISQIGYRGILTGTRGEEGNRLLEEHFNKIGKSWKEGMDDLKKSANKVNEITNQIDEFEEEKNEIFESAMNEGVVDNKEYDLIDSGKDRKERMGLVSGIFKDNSESDIIQLAVTSEGDEYEKLDVEENQKLLEVFRRDLGNNSFKDSEITSTSLLKNDLQSGIKVNLTLGKDDVEGGEYGRNFKPGDKIELIVSPKDLNNGETPTYLKQYLDSAYGTKGVRQFAANIHDNKYPPTTDKEQLGKSNITTDNIFFNGDNKTKIDYLSESEKVGDNVIQYQSPYIIDEDGNKNPLKLKEYISNIKNSKFSYKDPEFINFVKDFYNDMVESGKHKKDFGTSKFEDKYETQLENGGIEVDDDEIEQLINSIEDYNLIFRDSSNKYRMNRLAEKYKNI